jgi:hypothetical protein
MRWAWWSADTNRYFEGGISSVYLWDMDDGFAGCVLLKKGAYYIYELLLAC